MSYFMCLGLDHVKKDMPTKSGVFFLNGLTFHKHKMDALISQSTHYTQFIYEPNLIGNNILLKHIQSYLKQKPKKMNLLQSGL